MASQPRFPVVGTHIDSANHPQPKRVPSDDEYRVMRWYSRYQDGLDEFQHTWTDPLRIAFRRLVNLGWIDEDWSTTVTPAGRAAMRLHRRECHPLEIATAGENL